MTPPAARLAPSPLRPALLLLVPLALLASVLLGLLAQSAAAHHTPAAPSITGPVSPGTTTSPTWSFTRPADSTDPGTPEYDPTTGATTTVTIAHDYSTECAYDAPGAGDVTVHPCGVSFTGTADSYTGSVADGDGTYTLTVRTSSTTTTTTTTETTTGTSTDVSTSDPVYSAPASTTYLHDTTAPTITVTSPSGSAYTGWTVTRTDTGGSDVGYRCQVTGPSGPGTGFTCNTGTVQPVLGADGDYTLTVTATDAATNSTTVTSSVFTYDGTAPVVDVVLTTTTPNSVRTPQWGWTVDGGAVTCVLTGPNGSVVQTTSCTGGSYTAPSLTQSGTYTLTVSSTDLAGNTGSDSAAYVLDLVPPTVTVSPSASTTGTDPGTTWTIGVSDATDVTCTVFGADSVTSSCTATGGTVTATRTSDGVITLRIVASDAYGNTTTRDLTYTRDTTPATPVVTVPVDRASAPTVSWTVTLGANTTSASCVLTRDGQPATDVAVDCSALVAPGTYTVTTALTTDGVHVLRVTASTSTSPAQPSGSASYTLDRAAADGPVLTSGHSGTSGNASPLSWTWTVAAGHTTECRLTVAGGTPSGWTECAGSFSTTPTTQGSHLLEVRHVDDLGNRGSISTASYVFDSIGPTAPTVTLVGADPRQPGSTSWTVTATNDTATVECRLRAPGAPTGAWEVCGTTVTRTLTGDGTHTLDVRLLDAAGNPSEVRSSTVVVDGTPPPAPLVPGESTRGTTRSLTWSFTHASADGTSFRCRLLHNGAGPTDFTACSSNYTVTVTADGAYQLVVVSVDAAGNISGPTSGPTHVVDTTGPLAPAVTLATASGNLPRATWTVTPAGDAVRSDCRLTHTAGGITTEVQAWTACTGYAFDLTAGDGVYVLQVRTYDDLGNVGAAATGAGYTLDATPPDAPAVSGSRSGTDNETAIRYTFDGDGAPSCALHRDGVLVTTYASCASPFDVTLPRVDGVYTLVVTYTDSSGNTGPAGESQTYTLDVTPPATPTVTGSRSGTDNETSISYAFSGEGTATCRLYRGTTLVQSFAGCHAPSPFVVTLPQVDGVYTLQVEFTDLYGNTGGTGTSQTYTLDVTPPAMPTVTGSRSGTDNETSVSYTYSGEGTATCRLYRDGAVVTAADAVCGPSGYTATLPRVDGVYTLQVTFTDQYGNTGPAGESQPYTLDVTPPATPTVTGSRTGTDNERSLTYDFTGEGTAVCRLYRDGQLVETTVDCHGPPRPFAVTLPATSGSYVLTVTFTDQHGNEGRPGSSAPYVLDVTPPGPATVTVSPATGNVRRATWTVTPPEPGTTSECRLRHTVDGVTTTVLDWTACAAPYTFDLPRGDGLYVLDVRLTDAVGNLGPEVAGQGHLLDVTPPSVPTVLSDRTGPDNERVVTYTFSGEGTATCRLTRDGVAVGAAVVGCTSAYTITLPDVSGRYVLLVTYTDAVGNVSAAGASPEYALDVTAPSAPSVVADRSGTDNEPVVTYTFSGEGTATCQLTRDGAAVGAVVACSSPYVVTLPSVDGSYVLLVRYTDAVGNTGVAGASVAYLLDLTPPPAPVVSGPPATGSSRAVSWSYSGEGTATCTLLRDGVVVSAGVACGPTGYSTTLPTDGAWTLAVTFTDAVGNRGPPGTSAPYLLDTVAPSAPRATGPTGPSQSRTPAWSVSTDAGTTTACRLVRGGIVVNDWAACAGAFAADLTALPDGAYVLESRATDAAGNVSAVGSSAPYVLDTTAPAGPSVTGPSGPSQSRTPGFTWTGEAGARAECQLTRDGAVVGGWVVCASGYAPTLAQDGTWTLAVRLTDAAGNTGESASSGGYVLDTTAPGTPLVTPPSTPGRDLAPSWGAVVEGGAALECRLTGPDGAPGAWAPCSLPHVTSLIGRPDGTYVLEVRATDVAGNVSPVGRGSYVLDTVAPAAAVVVAPASPGRTRSPTFTFTTEAGAVTRCRLTSGATLISDFALCSSPHTRDLTGLPDGTYTLTVRITDAAGNPGPAASGSYVLDTTGPSAPVFTLTPASPSPSRTATFAVTAEPGSTLVCRLAFPTGAVREISACSSPLTVDLTGLPDGSYTLTVRAVDAAGNVGAVATAVHVLDSSALIAPEIQGPFTPNGPRTPRWTVTVAFGAAECRLVRGSTVLRDWSRDCGTNGSYLADLFGQPDGTYTLQARTSLNGAVSASSSSSYVLDTTPPAAATLVAPPTPSTNRRPTWSISSPEAGATAMCRVLVFDSVLRDWAACAVSPAGSLHTVDLTGLGDGTYTLVVRLTDAAGNPGATTATSSYVLDTSAPVAVGVTGPPSPGNDRNPTWRLSTSGGASLECRLSSAAGVVADWAPCAGEYTADLTGAADGTYTLAVRAVSAAGTPGPETTSAYVLSTIGPAAPTAVALSGVRSPSNDRSPTWTFTLPSGTAGFCRVVHGTRQVFAGACSSPYVLDLSSAGDGTYTLTVFAVDRAGNRTAAAPSSYILDTEPTDSPVFSQVPGATGSTLAPQWRWTVVRNALSECRLLYGGRALDDWASCASPYTATLTGRPDGTYVLQVRAVDAAGNTSAPVSDSYLLNRTAAPVPTFTGTPVTPGNEPVVSWTVTGPGGSALECRVVGPDRSTEWGTCGGGAGGALRTTSAAALVSATVRLDLTGRPDGDYALEVRVRMPDGTVGGVSRATYRLDTRAPAAPAFSSVPTPAVGNSPTPTWQWSPSGDVLVECRLVRMEGPAVPGWQACADGRYDADLARLEQGDYALELRVTDAAGNTSPVSRAVYRYDTTRPAAPVFTSRPPATGADRTVSWSFTVPPDTTATCTVTRDFSVVRRESSCSGRYELNLSGLPDGRYTLSVRYTDAAGNDSVPSTSTYGLATLRAGGPVPVGPPGVPFEPLPGGSGGGVPAEPLPGPGRVGSGAPGDPSGGGSTSAPGAPVLTTDDDVLRSSDGRLGTDSGFPPASGQQDAGPTGPALDATTGGNPLLPKDVVDAPVPDVIRDVAIGAIKRPTLPLALLAIVVLFLLAQNRIDRRDPKLSAAPVEAEPELDFSAFVGASEGTRS